MSGGLLQLVAHGTQDIYLTGNPQITFFKIVYRRHTNFAIETIEQQFVGNIDFGKRLTTVFSRNADLINKLYIKVTMESFDPQGNNFAYVRRLGHAIINNVEIELGGTIIDRHYGQWLDIWYEIAHKKDHERGYAHMIGDVPSMIKYNTDIKPQYTMYIPLQFWFNRHVGGSIPVIALQYHDMRINVTIADKEKLYVKDCNLDDTLVSINDVTILANYIYLDTEERRRFARVGHEYLIEQLQFNGVEPVVSLKSRYTLDYNHPTKEIIWAIKNGNFINGSTFMYYSHLDIWDYTDDDSPTVLELGAKKIVEESVSVGVNPTATIGGNWEIVLDNSSATIGTFNITNNSNQLIYVNPESLVVGTYGITDKINADVLISNLEIVDVHNVETTLTVRDFSIPTTQMIDTRLNPCDPIVYQFNNYGILIDGSVNPVQTAILHLNGHERFDPREGIYFNYIQPLQHHSNTPKDGVNVYSFSLFPEEHQPGGSSNLSRISDVQLTLTVFESTSATGLPTINFLNDDNELYVFGTNYNILRILSGLAGIAYNVI